MSKLSVNSLFSKAVPPTCYIYYELITSLLTCENLVLFITLCTFVERCFNINMPNNNVILNKNKVF